MFAAKRPDKPDLAEQIKQRYYALKRDKAAE
jgi:hypothetical protein